MQCTIFHLQSQAQLALKLRDSLTRDVYRGLAPELCNVEKISSSELYDRYFKLVCAASNPMLQFSVRQMEYVGYSLYIQYHYFASGWISPAACFPAIAINWRMVLVPNGMRHRISDMPLFRELDKEGLAEAEFEDEAALSRALARIAVSIRAETAADLAATASYMDKDAASSVAVVASRAGVDVDYVQSALSPSAAEQAIHKPVRCDVQPRALTFGRWTKVELRIENHRDDPLRYVSVAIRGPVKVRPQSVVIDIGARSEARLPVALYPEDKGEFPIELQLRIPGGASREWLPVQHVWISSD